MGRHISQKGKYHVSHSIAVQKPWLFSRNLTYPLQKGYRMFTPVKHLSFRIPRSSKNLHFTVTVDSNLSSILSDMYVLYKSEYENIHQERFPILRWTDEYAQKIVMEDGTTFNNKRELEKACKDWLADVWNEVHEEEMKCDLVKNISLMELKQILKKAGKLA